SRFGLRSKLAEPAATASPLGFASMEIVDKKNASSALAGNRIFMECWWGGRPRNRAAFANRIEPLAALLAKTCVKQLNLPRMTIIGRAARRAKLALALDVL